MPNVCAIGALLCAALLEVWGDRVIAHGLDSKHRGLVAAGCLLLAFYGIAVNSYNARAKARAQMTGEKAWDLAHLLGLYIVFFAWTAVIWAQCADPIKPSKATYLGATIIFIGGVIIQLGNK